MIKKQNGMAKGKEKKFKIVPGIILGILASVVLTAIVTTGFVFIKSGFKFSVEILKKVLASKIFIYIILFSIFAGICLFIYIAFLTKKEKTTEEDLKDKSSMQESKLNYPADLKKENMFTSCNSLNNLKKIADGTLLFAEKLANKTKNKLDMLFTKTPMSTVAVGAPGTGKTQSYVNPNIQILARTKTKPSMIIVDPKGELYQLHSKMLEKQGYIVTAFDLRNPYKSSKWDPFQNIKNLIQEDLKLENNDGNKVIKAELRDKIYNQTRDLIQELCPTHDAKDPIWENGARDLILASSLGIIEDVQAGKADINQINLATISHNLSNHMSIDNKAFMDYFNSRPDNSMAKFHAQTVLGGKDAKSTFSSYKSVVNNYLRNIGDKGIQQMTIKNEIDFSKFDENPNALFLQIPDEQKSRHEIATVMISQSYKALIDKANKNLESGETSTEKLKRNTYYIIDEFGNMPKIENMGSMLAVCRSRGIAFNLIVQNYEQLSHIYGPEIANTIKHNCPIKMFIGTDSTETMKEFIELAGTHYESIVSQNSKDESTTTTLQEKPLLNITDLRTLNTQDDMGNALVAMVGQPMIVTKYTPSFDFAGYEFGATEKPNTTENYIDVNEQIFDIQKNYDLEYQKIQNELEEIKNYQKHIQERKAEMEQVIDQKINENEKFAESEVMCNEK